MSLEAGHLEGLYLFIFFVELIFSQAVKARQDLGG